MRIEEDTLGSNFSFFKKISFFFLLFESKMIIPGQVRTGQDETRQQQKKRLDVWKILEKAIHYGEKSIYIHTLQRNA